MGAHFKFEIVVAGTTEADYSYNSGSANAPKNAKRALVAFAQEHAPKGVTVEVALVAVDRVAVTPEVLLTEVFDADGTGATIGVVKPKIVSEGFFMIYPRYTPEIMLDLYDMSGLADVDLGTLPAHSSREAVLAALAYECYLYEVSQDDFATVVRWFVRMDGQHEHDDDVAVFGAIHSTARNVLQSKMARGEGFDD